MKKVLIPILALVLALGLALPMAAPVAANPTTIWEIGDIETIPPNSSSDCNDEFKTSSWSGIESFTYDVDENVLVQDPSTFPSQLYTSGYSGSGKSKGVHEVTIEFDLDQWYGNLQLEYARLGAEGDEVSVDSGPAQSFTGPGEGVQKTHIIDIGVLPQGTHSIVIACVDEAGAPGNHYVDAVKLTGDPLTVTPIRTDTFTWMAPNSGNNLTDPTTWTGEVEIVEMMLNEADTTAFYAAMNETVTGQEAFIYEVTNVSWVPIFGLNGFSGFNIYNQFDVDTVGNAFGPPGWEAFAGYSGTNTEPNPDNFEWDIRDTVGNGLLVGQTGLFGFTVAAGKYIDVSYGIGHWMHSWLGGQTDITYQDDISGPAPFVTKEMTAGPTVVPLYTDQVWNLTITVTNNDASMPMTGVVVKDNLGGDLELLEVNGGSVKTPESKKDSDSIGDVDVLWTGKTYKAHITWDVGTLDPGESQTMVLTVSTDMNTGHGNGKNPKFPEGHQEYTETGTHCLNSGANAKGILRDVQVSATSDPICVEVTEAVLTLENKDSGWQIIEDGTWGEFGYNLAGPTFDYAFNVYGLESDTDYSLIYYADFHPRFNVWGGNNPGALIATMTTESDGSVCISGSIDLGMDLPCSPDWNINPDPDYCDNHNGFDDYDHCSGAKIWLVPSDCYNGVDTVTAWQPTRFLFETDLIWYDDTDV